MTNVFFWIIVVVLVLLTGTFVLNFLGIALEFIGKILRQIASVLNFFHFKGILNL